MGTVQVLPATRNAARRYEAELTLLICGVTQPDAVMSALRTAEQTFADLLEADGIDLAENGTHVVSDPFMAGPDVAIYADLGDAPGAIVDRWVQLIAQLAAVDPGVTDVRLPRRRSRIAALFVDTHDTGVLDRADDPNRSNRPRRTSDRSPRLDQAAGVHHSTHPAPGPREVGAR